jgi:hypothetical protein
VLTLEDILTSSGRYPDRAASPECTEEVRRNAQTLCNRVNGLLLHLSRSPRASSGFRTKAANAAAGGAPHSHHLKGEAVDLEDRDGSLEAAITDELLAQFGLYREDPKRTVGWVHIQSVAPASGHRTFMV